MAKQRKVWMFSPGSKKPEKLTDSLKAEVSAAAELLVKNVLKPNYVRPPEKNPQFNYITDVGTKWYRNYFYFFATYSCPGPNVLEPTFEAKFARLESAGNKKFVLSAMRHTGEWIRIFDGLSLQECLDAIRDDPWFGL